MSAAAQSRKISIPDLEAFAFRSYDKLRYADTDKQGHVNNAVFNTFLETGRAELLYDPEAPLAAEESSFVIASLSLDFRSEAHWPGRIDIGTAVTRIGNSSLTFFQALYQEGRCVATADSVIVQVSAASGRPAPLSEAARAFFEGHRLVLQQPT